MVRWLHIPPVWLVAALTLAYVQGQHFGIGLPIAHPLTTLLASGMIASFHLYKNFASPIAEAAKVFIGPALMALTLIFF